MSIEKCLDDKVKAGVLRRDLAEEALKHTKRLQRQYQKTMNSTSAEAAASWQAAQVMKEVAERRKLQRSLRILAAKRAKTIIDQHSKGRAAGLMALLTRDIFEESQELPAAVLTEILEADFVNRFDIGIETLRSKFAGLSQDKVQARDFITALYGGETKNEVAKAMAKAWNDMTDYTANRFKAAGGEIVEFEEWRLHQMHDADRLRQEGKDKWAARMYTDYENGDLDIIDFKTGERANELMAQKIIDQAFDHIVSRVHQKPINGMAGFHALKRVFHWTNSEAWLRYNDDFGAGSGGIYNLLANHIRNMARDIALTETLGPAHRGTMEAMVRYAIEGESKIPNKARKFISPERWTSSPRLALNTYRYMVGDLSIPVGENLAFMGSGIRGWLTASQLGSATVTAVTGDTATALIAAHNLGIPSVRLLKSLAGFLANGEHVRANSARAGIVAHSVADNAIGTARFGDEMLGRELGSRLADFVIRASGLAHWTNSAKKAFMLEFYGLLADQSSKGFDKVDSGVKRFFDRYGITEDEWNKVRESLFEGPDGATFWDPVSMADRKTAEKVQGAIMQERAYAVIEPDPRVRAMLTLGTQRGTFWGEVARSSAMYKSFSVSILLTSLTRAIYRTPERGGYGASGWARLGAWGAANLTLLFAGAMSLQMRQLVAGKDVRDMSDPAFWGAAFITGGGSGFLGDYLYSGYARGERGFITGLVGPVAGAVEDISRLALPNVRQAIEGQDTKFGGEASRFLRYNAPGGNIWYARLVLDRMLWDNVSRLIDPEADASFGRMEKKLKKVYGQGYYWKPGSLLPDREPRIGTAPQ